MADDKKLLECISQTADMGSDSLKQILDKAKDKEMTKILKYQMSEYRNNYDDAWSMLKNHREKPKKANPLAKAQAKMVSGIKIMTAEEPDSKIAEMVMRGSTMGVTKVTKELNKYYGSNQPVVSLAKRHIKTQQESIDQMKQFL